MDHLVDIYNKRPDLVEKLLSIDNVKVNLKVDGKPFQVLVENNEIHYHGLSDDESHVGPEIDDYTRLFSKSINYAISKVEENKDLYINNYKFYTFEVINDKMLLTAVIDDNDKFIESASEIRTIADCLETDIMPTLWERKLTESQIDSIINILKSGIAPKKEDFINWLKETFGEYEFFCEDFINEYPTLVEGASFIFTVSDKLVNWNISIEKDTNVNEDLDEKNKETLDKIYNIFNEFKENVIWNQSENILENLQINFERMMSLPKTYNKLMNLGSKLNINENEETSIQKDMLNKSLRKNIQMKGTIYKTLFESFVKLFYNERES